MRCATRSRNGTIRFSPGPSTERSRPKRSTTNFSDCGTTRTPRNRHTRMNAASASATAFVPMKLSISTPGLRPIPSARTIARVARAGNEVHLSW